MRKATFTLILLLFLSSLNEFSFGKHDSQTKVETDEFNQIQCIIIDACRECSYQELKQIKECKQNSFIQTQRCFYKNAKDENDMYDEMEYHACADKDTKFLKNIHLFFAFIALGFFISIYKLNSKKYEIENQWFLSLKK